MRDLPALQIYSMEEFELSKWAQVKTAERCVEVEGKIQEIQNVIDDLKKNKPEYKNDRMVDRISSRLECAVNFLKKSCGEFTSVTNEMVKRRQELDERRIKAQQSLEESKRLRTDAIAEQKPAPAPIPDKSDTIIKRRPRKKR